MSVQTYSTNYNSALPFLRRTTVEELSRMNDQQKKQVLIFLVNSFTSSAANRSESRFASEADCLAHLESLCVTDGQPVPADIDDFDLFVQKHL